MKNKILSFITTWAMLLTFVGIMPVIEVEAVTSSDLSISDNGISFICAREGFHSTCYSDSSQSSIGYGTKCTGSSIQPHASGLHTITREAAMAAMKTQINSTYAPRVRKQTSGIEMNQNQFDALVSLCYNCGGGNTMISNSPLVKYLKGELNETQARSQYSNYIVTSGGKKLQGLVNRRNAEADLFFKDSPTLPVQNNDTELGINYPRPSGSPLLSTGSTGSGVYWLQTALNKANNAGLAVDGQFGSGTKQAVINFQKANGLDADGIAGPTTINKLVEVIKGGIKPNLEAPNLKIDINGQDVTFSWNTISNATHYDLRIYYENENSYKNCWGITQTSVTETLPANTKFKAQVCSANANYENCWQYCYPIEFQTGVNGSPIDVGTDFYAIISNVSSKYLLSNINQNATMAVPTDETNQYWYFTRNSNGSYTIESYDRTQALDVAGGKTDDGTNIGLYEKNGTLAQQWYLYWADGGMYFKSALGNYCLDVSNGISNAYLWSFNETKAQIYEFYRIDLDGNMPNDMGEYFFAKIINTATGKALSNINNANLAGEVPEYKEEQTWCFIRLDNGSYKIMSYYDVDQSLDIVNFGTTNATNVGVCIDSHNIAQRFFLYDIGSDIYIKPMCSNNVFNMDMNTLNVSTWNYVKGVDPERFSIKKLDEDKDVKIEIVSKPNKLVYNVGDELNTEGLVIKQIYETGTSFTTSSGFTVDKKVLKVGDNKVTVTYEGKTTTFDITVNSLKGDINADGNLTVSDAVLLQKWLLAVPDTNIVDWKAADLCEDGVLNVFDLCLIKRMLIENS